MPAFLYEDDSDQDKYLYPLPMVDESNDSPEDLMALSRQVLCDTGAARSVCPTTFRTRCSARELLFGSKFLNVGVGAQKIEGRFDVRNVTKTGRCCRTGDGHMSGSVAER